MTLTPSDWWLLRQHLQRDEGVRLLPYIDIVGKITIGCGRNLSDNGITRAEAETMLDHDMEVHAADLYRVFPFVVTLDPVRQMVLINMCFNLGLGRLSMFRKMWHALEARDFAQAAAQMLESRWAEQTGARATRLATAMARGTFL